MKNILFFLILISMQLKAQENPLSIFKPLEPYTWSAAGTWGDGSSFKQELSLEFRLNNTLVQVTTNGYTNKEQTTFGMRNHGIRQYDSYTNLIRFWEFDVFGNVTEGTVKNNGKNIIYTYNYDDTLLTEMWSYKNDTTYDFIIGIYENGRWKKIFLETQFKGRPKSQ